ncbi:C-type lectin domain family 1 member A-like [Alligator sinensis]|uniref:C-type lectin domain family 1 member A-like n=1 Tax=Alligator sinensis TaxID=38654 RepID=A0A3Q0HBQ9_ALLSI|nr:C-type lectin domain family 1 member A-like [Alligator sinensis]
MSQPSPESLPAESKPAALDLLGMHGQDDASSDLRLETPPELQRQIPWHAGHTETAPASPPWSPIPLVLGIMLVCLLFLITARVYGAQMAQLGIERKSLLEQVGYLSSELTSCQNQGIPGTVRELPHDIGEKCPARWSHSTNRSYLFSPKKRRWDQCKYSCSSHSASLITMDSREELDFIMTESFHYSEDRGSTTYYFPFWTGLVYDSLQELGLEGRIQYGWTLLVSSIMRTKNAGLKQREQGRYTFLCPNSEVHHPPLVICEEKEKHNGPELVLVSELLGLQWNDADWHQQKIRPGCMKEPHL